MVFHGSSISFLLLLHIVGTFSFHFLLFLLCELKGPQGTELIKNYLGETLGVLLITLCSQKLKHVKMICNITFKCLSLIHSYSVQSLFFSLIRQGCGQGITQENICYQRLQEFLSMFFLTSNFCTFYTFRVKSVSKNLKDNSDCFAKCWRLVFSAI